MADKDLETQDGAQQKADAAESAAESYADGEIESHRQNETHATAQPPENHGNQAHITDFLDAAEYTPEADTHDRYTGQEAAAAAPVQTVNGQRGRVTVDSVTDHSGLNNVEQGQHNDFYFNQSYNFDGGQGDTLTIPVGDTSYFPLLLTVVAEEYEQADFKIIGYSRFTYVLNISGVRATVEAGKRSDVPVYVDGNFPGFWDVTLWSV